ncbi:MAG TPA: adenosine deaminase [Conexibacter sp.]|nr:adenosine deaminase [Conexibacter sp.]
MLAPSPSNAAPVTAAWVRSLPKAEVHVHLEGAIAPDHLARLAEAAGEPLRPPFADLAQLLDFLDWSCGLVREPDDLRTLAYDFAARKHASGVRCLDVVMNPTHWAPWRDRLPQMLDALDEGFARAERDGLPRAALCVSILRTQTREQACALAEQLVALRHPRVAALSIDGDEAAAGRTGARFAPAFRIAREGGLRTTAHAGESSGPEGVRDALELLEVERLDHGVRAIEDAALVAELARRRVPLGVTPLANLRLGMWGGHLPDHPVDALRRAGVRVSINTDDPVCPERSLEENYVRCAEAFGWSRADVAEMVRTGIEASFAPPRLRDALLDELDDMTGAARGAADTEKGST